MEKRDKEQALVLSFGKKLDQSIKVHERLFIANNIAQKACAQYYKTSQIIIDLTTF